MRITEKKENGFYELKEGQEIYGEENGIRLVQVVGQYEDIEEFTNIPFAKISSLKVGDVVYFKRVTFSEGKISNINYENLTITVLDKEGTFIDFMLFHQYGKNRNTPLHCWFGAWALTKEELE